MDSESEQDKKPRSKEELKKLWVETERIAEDLQKMFSAAQQDMQNVRDIKTLVFQTLDHLPSLSDYSSQYDSVEMLHQDLKQKQGIAQNLDLSGTQLWTASALNSTASLFPLRPAYKPFESERGYLTFLANWAVEKHRLREQIIQQMDRLKFESNKGNLAKKNFNEGWDAYLGGLPSTSIGTSMRNAMKYTKDTLLAMCSPQKPKAEKNHILYIGDTLKKQQVSHKQFEILQNFQDDFQNKLSGITKDSESIKNFDRDAALTLMVQVSTYLLVLLTSIDSKKLNV